MRFPARLFLALALLAVAAAVRADERPPDASTWAGLLSPGLKARLQSTAFSGRIEGRVQSADDSVLVLGTEDGVAVRVPTSTVTRLEVSTHRKRVPLKGALVGAGIGLVGALVATSLDDVDCGGFQGEDDFCSDGEAVASLTFGGALWGLGIGALVKEDAWTEARLPALTVAPVRGGVRVAVTLRY